MQFNIKKTLDLSLKKPGPPYWAWVNFGLGLEKCSDNITGVRLNLWYIGVGLEKHLDCLTGLRLILSYIKLGLIKWINQAETPLENYLDFLELFVKQLIINQVQFP